MIQELSARDCIDIGLSAYHRNDNAVAKKHFEEALKLDPSAYEAMNHLGIIALSENVHENAIAWWVKSIDLEDNAEANSNLGFYYSKAEELEKAKPYLKRAFELEGHRLDAILQFAYIEVMAGNFLAAEKVLVPLLNHEMFFEQVHIALARVKLDQKQHKQAVQTLEELLEKAPDSIEGHHNLARTHMGLGNFEAADGYFSWVIQHSSFQPDLTKEYATLLIQRGQAEKCIALLEDALTRINNDWELFWLMASSQEMAKQPEKALQYFSAAMNLNPFEASIRQKVASLQQQLAAN